MRYTYVGASNITGNATALASTEADCYVKKIIFGTPADGKVIKLYNKAVAFGHASAIASTDSTDIALYFTQATHAAGTPFVQELNLAGEFNRGLKLNGGCVHTDGANVTIIWDDK